MKKNMERVIEWQNYKNREKQCVTSIHTFFAIGNKFSSVACFSLSRVALFQSYVYIVAKNQSKINKKRE